MKLILFLLIFLMIGVLFIVSENKLSLKDTDARAQFKDKCFAWCEQLFDNSKNIMGHVVKQNWIPEN